MAEHRIETKILLRYATYNQWLESYVILKEGEAAVAIFPDTNPNNPPKAIGIKIGDGRHYFDELPWIQALAADVYNWAKTVNKPIYYATEIEGLAEYIQAHSGGGSGGGGSTSGGQYRIIYDSPSSKYILQEWDESLGEWVSTASEINLSDILNRLNTIERWANGALTQLGNIEMPLTAYVYEEVITQLSKLTLIDEEVEGEYVTGVDQNYGKITVHRAPINASYIETGVLSSLHGGTGLTGVNEDEVLIGSLDGSITTKNFITTIENNRDTFPTTGAVIDYVTAQTAGLTGAMHFIGEAIAVITNNSAIDPQIRGYNFRNAQPGDVVLGNNAQEYVWTGNNWRLLGDEGSYAVKGSIVNADISENADIAQSKIEGLTDALDGKVDKEDGKSLFTSEEREKLAEIEEGAQVNLIEHLIVNDVEAQPNSEKTINLTIPVLTEEQINKINSAEPNVIEHIFVNGSEVNPSTINSQPKSVNISHVMTDQDVEKLASIQSGAQVNAIETISFNGGEPLTPNAETKNVDITIDASALHLTVLEGARYPSGNNSYISIDKDSSGKILELSKVAATGNIDDLIQTTNYFILNCGSSVEVI